MQQAGVTIDDRKVAKVAKEIEEKTGSPAVAIELEDGTMITGKTSDLLGSSAAALLNAVKKLGKIEDDVKLVSPQAIEPIQTLKTQYLGSQNPRLHTDEILIALSSTAANSEVAKVAMKQLHKLKGCQAHSTVSVSYTHLDVYKRQVQWILQLEEQKLKILIK